MDRRRYPRVQGTLSAVQILGVRRVACQVRELSAGGCFVEIAESTARPGDLVVMELSGDQEVVRVTAEVRDVRPGGFAVQITRADWDRLGRLIGR